MSKLLCIYHGHCDDGFGAAYAVWRALGDDVEFYPGVYQKEPPDVTGRDVLLVDFSYKRPVLEAMAERAARITVFDHHKSAMLEWQEDDPDASCLYRIIGNLRFDFDMKRSGAMMAWDHFHGRGTHPLFFTYLQDRDLWLKEMPGGDQFTMALRSYPQTFEAWDPMVRAEDGVALLIEEGEHILRYYRRSIEEAKRFAFRRDIAGHNVPVCNAPYSMASDLAGELAIGEPFGACFFEGPDGVTFSLRSRAGGVDVSEIAKQFGGGGHRHAAGFRWANSRPSNIEELRPSDT